MSKTLTPVAVLAESRDAALVRERHFEALVGLPVVASEDAAKGAPVEARLVWTERRQPRGDFRPDHAGAKTWWLADGFLRSGGIGRPDPALSLLLDDQRHYEDCRGPSRLEGCIKRALDDQELGRGRHLMAAWQQGRVSKWNHHRDSRELLPDRYVLVIDQDWRDPALARAGADRGHFKRMLQAAISENPGAAFLIWNPSEKRLPWLSAGCLPKIKGVAPSRVSHLKDPAHAARILRHAEAVYTVSSYLGFEALIWAKRVRTFGMPFYAGWSLTEDELAAPPTRHSVSREQLVHGALVAYARYVDPETGKRCEVERVIEHISLQRRMQERFPRVVHAVGFSDKDTKWKQPLLRRFLQGSQVRFVANASRLPSDTPVAIWGAGMRSEQTNDKRPHWRIEDGFLRSVGLGAQLVEPLSWVIDRSGIYYDPSRPSDLEQILETAEIPEPLCRRAAQLRQKIAGAGITKYNVGSAAWRRPATDRKVILVPGQVESDLSIVYGAHSIRTNRDLLCAVRAESPEAYVVFKPHPDVLAGLRKSDAASRGEAPCDEIVGSDVSMGAILGEVDEVHTMTSLAGFEALLRDKRVVAYGIPFYAGWGLTDDKTTAPRRTRRLTLDMLVAGTLILYPTYVSRVTGRYTSPERVLVEIEDWRASQATVPA